MNTSLSKKSKHLSISYSFTKSSSFSQCPNISIKKRRHTSSYKELYLNRINFVSTQTPTSKPKGLDYLYATIYKSNTAKLKHSEYPFTSNINNIINSNMHTNRVIDRYRSSNDVHTKLKDLKKEMMSVNKFNSGNCSRGRFNNNIYNGIKNIIYSKASANNGNGAKRLFKDGECSSKCKGEMILEGLGVDKSFERRMNEEEMVYSDIKVNNINDNNEDDTNFLITDRQEKSVLKGTLVDHNEKGDYEDMNEIKNQLDNAIARSNNVKCKLTCSNNVDYGNEIDKQHEIIITSQTDININNCNCNVIFKSDSFNYGIINAYNNVQHDNNPNTMNINSTSTNSHSKQTQNIIQCNNPTSSEDIEVTSSIPINFQSTTSLDIVKSAKHLHEHRYSNEDNEQEHDEVCCSSSQREVTPTCEDNNNGDNGKGKGKGHVIMYNHEIKEEDEEYDESVGVSVLKQVKKRTQHSSSNNECKLVIEEIQNQKKKLLNMKQSHINNDYERLQKIKTLLHKTTHTPISAVTNNNNNNINNVVSSTNHVVTSLNKSPLTITNTSLTIYNNNIKSLTQHNNNNNHHKQPLSLSTQNTYLTLSNEQTFNILSTPKIYSPNNINTIHISQPPSQPQFNPNELHSEIDAFLTNIKLRNKSKETHLTSLKLQKAQELQQLKTKQQLFLKQKQHLTHSHKEPPTYTSINTNNHRTTTNLNHQQQQEPTTTTLSSVKKNTNTYTSIFNTLLEDERYNTLRSNMSKRCMKDNRNKYGEMFNQEVEKESDLFLKKVKEDIRGINSKRKVKEELNAFVYGNTWGSRYVNAVGKRNNCVMPVNSIDGVGDKRDIGFFTSYMNNNNNNGSSSNNYIFKK